MLWPLSKEVFHKVCAFSAVPAMEHDDCMEGAPGPATCKFIKQLSLMPSRRSVGQSFGVLAALTKRRCLGEGPGSHRDCTYIDLSTIRGSL